MSNNQLNDISKVYLSQVAEETPGERIDRKSQEGVAKRKAAAASEKEDRVKKAGEFQKHKQSILAKGGRHVDALDSWHKKQAYERNAKTRSEALMSSEELKEKEIYKGKHGQSEKEYQAGRSDAGKRISGDEKHGPASYTRRGVVDQKPTKPGEKPEHTPKLGSAEKNELAYRKSRLKKEEEVTEGKVSVGPRLGEPRTKGSTAANAGQGEKIQKRTLKWMRDRGQTGAPGLNAMKERQKEHEAKRGVKEELELAYRKSRLKKEDVEFVDNLIESGKFSDEEIEKIVEAQVARNNPEKYERDQEKNDTRSKKQKRMDDPNTGINSPAFKKFMQQQGM